MSITSLLSPDATAIWILAATSIFLVICGAAQFLRRDIDPVAVPLTLYLNGPGGSAVRLSYYVMASGLLALAGHLGSREAARPLALAAAALIAISAAMLPVLVATRPVPGHPSGTISLAFHRLSTYFTFISLIAGMAIVSFDMTSSGQANGTSVLGVLLVFLATIALGLSIFARKLPHGLVQKFLILLIVFWLYWFGVSMLRP